MKKTKILGGLSFCAVLAVAMSSCEKNIIIDTEKPTPDKQLVNGIDSTGVIDSTNIPVSTSGLIAYWPLDSCSNAKDVTGNGHDGTAFNTTLTTDRFGNSGSAFYFNGTSSYISVNDKADIRLTNTDFTLSAWVKLDSYNSSWGSHIMSKRNLDSGFTWGVRGLLDVAPGTIGFGPGGGASNAAGIKQVTTGSWHMITNVYNYATHQVIIYIDGVLDNVSSGILPTNAPSTANLYIGRDNPAMPTAYFWKGSMDDIRIYNRVLKPNEVKSLYNQTMAPVASLIAYWPLNICAGANDLSGLGHNGTPSNITYTKDRLGDKTGASYFNGTNSYIAVNDQVDLRFANVSFSMNAWVNLDSYNSSWGSHIMSKRYADSGFTWGIRGLLDVAPGTIGFGPGGGSTNAVGIKQVTTGNWHMITNVYNVSTKQVGIYIDGVLDAVSNNILPVNAPSTVKLYIGRDEISQPTSYFMKGGMEDIRIYGKILSAAEIRQLYNAVN
ncbi:LamG domain-containing protein [Chitinophaga silvatica]|uniref:LamG domain-containing protein n=1 Tax=Chitinophaga silvatica TaxID=2282649 RepID=A0A3E1YFS5_9BACT|nr:LamG domain-containing protein [Chitinophaga silvatica]RFS26216.1 LamG domain-containing protein [Chitinophaga silvatica]